VRLALYMPAGLELTNGLFRIPHEVTSDKLEILR
jgi:hypothetical protein